MNTQSIDKTMNNKETGTGDSRLKKMIKRHEGSVRRGGLHRVYEDSLGYKTVGYGHYIGLEMSKQAVNIVARVIGNDNWVKQGGLTDAEANKLFEYDFHVHKRELFKQFAWVKNLDTVRQAVLIDMNFNMGTERLSKFKTSLSLIKNGKYESACNSLSKTLWYKQTGIRAKEIIKMLRTGEWQ